MKRFRGSVLGVVLGLGLALAAAPKPALAQPDSLPRHLRDREAGIPTSMLGTYVHRHQLLVLPFYEHVSDRNQEYNTAILGFGLNEDFRGKFRSSSEAIFIAYGLSDKVALEFESAHMRASLEKSPADPTATPSRIEESGLSDLEGQLRIRLADERGRRPEIFGFVEVTAPTQKKKLLIGRKDWDARPGIGFIRGFTWGTMTIWSTFEYNREKSAIQEAAHVDIGETSIEYLRRLSRSWRFSLAFEGGEGGAPDEWELRPALQGRLADGIFLKLINSVGVSSKAPDWTPQIGLMFSLPPR